MRENCTYGSEGGAASAVPPPIVAIGRGWRSSSARRGFTRSAIKREADRLIVASPMIDLRARKVADRLGVETVGGSIDVMAL